MERQNFDRSPAPALAQTDDAASQTAGGVISSRTALFLDVDGTLLDIAARPEAAHAPDGLVPILAHVERALDGALALISGRSIADLDKLFAPLRLRASGCHGAEMRSDPNGACHPAPHAVALPMQFDDAVRTTLRDVPGLTFENKCFCYTIHYRATPDAGEQVRRRLERLLVNWPELDVARAHFAYEVKSPLCDKGRAIEFFLASAPFESRVPIFVGDDDVDEAGFAVVVARGGVACSVGRRRAGADVHFEAPAGVRAWLDAFVRSEGRR